jgi:hypothetical protein
MTDISTAVPATIPISRTRTRPVLQIDGDTWKPRDAFATDDLGVSPKTAQRMNLRTAYIGGVAYVPVKESLRGVAARACRRNEPPKRRRK